MVVVFVVFVIIVVIVFFAPRCRSGSGRSGCGGGVIVRIFIVIIFVLRGSGVIGPIAKCGRGGTVWSAAGCAGAAVPVCHVQAGAYAFSSVSRSARSSL